MSERESDMYLALVLYKSLLYSVPDGEDRTAEARLSFTAGGDRILPPKSQSK